jgi:hypothetical protein
MVAFWYSKNIGVLPLFLLAYAVSMGSSLMISVTLKTTIFKHYDTISLPSSTYYISVQYLSSTNGGMLTVDRYNDTCSDIDRMTVANAAIYYDSSPYSPVAGSLGQINLGRCKGSCICGSGPFWSSMNYACYDNVNLTLSSTPTRPTVVRITFTTVVAPDYPNCDGGQAAPYVVSLNTPPQLSKYYTQRVTDPDYTCGYSSSGVPIPCTSVSMPITVINMGKPFNGTLMWTLYNDTGASYTFPVFNFAKALTYTGNIFFGYPDPTKSFYENGNVTVIADNYQRFDIYFTYSYYDRKYLYNCTT